MQFFKAARHLRRQPHQRRQVGDKRIAAVFKVEFEWLRLKDRRASRRTAPFLRKPTRRVLKQEDSANPSLGFADDPETIVVLSDEEGRDGFADETGIGALKACGTAGSPQRRKLWARQRHGDHCTLFEGDNAAALRWLTAPRKALEGKTPLAYARTELGAREVEDLIGRLEHGVIS